MVRDKRVEILMLVILKGMLSSKNGWDSRTLLERLECVGFGEYSH